MTHTPGPWYVTGSSEMGTVHAANNRIIVPHIEGVNVNEPEDWDNRRLIAVAPELLAALETIVDRIAQVHKDVNTGEAEMPFVSMNFAAEGVWEIAVKAIAKAEGKEPQE